MYSGQLGVVGRLHRFFYPLFGTMRAPCHHLPQSGHGRKMRRTFPPPLQGPIFLIVNAPDPHHNAVHRHQGVNRAAPIEQRDTGVLIAILERKRPDQIPSMPQACFVARLDKRIPFFAPDLGARQAFEGIGQVVIRQLAKDDRRPGRSFHDDDFSQTSCDRQASARWRVGAGISDGDGGTENKAHEINIA
jgi:hypothetical protein